MTYTKIDVMATLAKKWGDRRALNWTPLTGCTEYHPKNKNVICVIRKLDACWAHEFTGAGFGEITYHPGNFTEPRDRKKSAVILFAWRSDIADAQINKLLELIETVKQCPHHAVFGLTKKPKLLGAKLESLRGINFPQNLHLGVSLNIQAELQRLRDLETYLGGLGAYFAFIEPAIGEWHYEAVKHTLEMCPSLKWLVIGGWSNLTDPEIQFNSPVIPQSVTEILKAAQEYEIPVGLKGNLPMEVLGFNPSKYPPKPPYLDKPEAVQPGLF